MHLLLLVLAMFACIAAGKREPLFFMGACLLLVWITVALFARLARWLLGLAPSAKSGARRNSRTSFRDSCTSDWEPGPGDRGSRPGDGSWPEAGRTRVCPDHLCGRVNMPLARFCAQCGRRLA